MIFKYLTISWSWSHGFLLCITLYRSVNVSCKVETPLKCYRVEKRVKIWPLCAGLCWCVTKMCWSVLYRTDMCWSYKVDPLSSSSQQWTFVQILMTSLMTWHIQITYFQPLDWLLKSLFIDIVWLHTISTKGWGIGYKRYSSVELTLTLTSLM